MSIEAGVIPGTPLFIKPSPKIDFVSNKVKAFRTSIPWPDKGYGVRRASINSLGYGGSNAHAFIEQPYVEARSHHVSSLRTVQDEEEEDNDEEQQGTSRPHIIVLLANDTTSLKANVVAISKHLINPRVKADLPDLAYKLSERRSKLWHRAFVTTCGTEINENDFTVGKKSPQAFKIGFVFTGQGAQWPQMGKGMLSLFPETRRILEELDDVLQAQSEPLSWSLVKELTTEIQVP